MVPSGKLNFVGLFFFLSFVAVGGGTYLFGPYYWDYLTMKEILRTSVLEWYATDNQAKGQSRLAHQLQKRELDSYIYPEDCHLAPQGILMTGRCYWVVDVYYPFTNYYKTLTFETTVEVNKAGDINQY